MRRVGGVVGARGAQRALRHAGVVARGGGSGGGGGGGGGNGGPPHLTQEQQRRAVGILSAARQLDLRRLGSQMGGTLLVDDATHKAEVQQAARDGTLSFGFSAGGCLFPYFIGSAGAMMDAGVLTGARRRPCLPACCTRLPSLDPPRAACCRADSVQLGGASAGSLLAATIKSGMPLDSIVEQNLRLMADLRAGGTRGRLGVRRPAAPPAPCAGRFAAPYRAEALRRRRPACRSPCSRPFSRSTCRRMRTSSATAHATWR